MKRTLLSVVIPCFNESEVLPLLYEKLSAALDKLDVDSEVILVDDGSGDSTRSIMADLSKKDPRFNAVILFRNFGHQIALSVGLAHTKGNAVAVLDADLQDPPELLGAMISKWREGYEVVYGKRVKREGESFAKLVTARLFYRFIRSLSGIPIPENAGDFRLMDRKVVEALNRLPERSRFIRGLVVWVGYKQYPLEFERPARAKGNTKYPWKSMFRFAFDAIFSFSVVPLRLASYAGLAIIALCGLLIIRALVIYFLTDTAVRGFTSVYFVILGIGGVNLLFLGIGAILFSVEIWHGQAAFR